jgi:hypothetical protein
MLMVILFKVVEKCAYGFGFGVGMGLAFKILPISRGEIRGNN